ncbi:hypothetical protein AAC387_Pa03g1795 [Persea americana]
MPAGPPEAIVTDQDPAMRKAIKHVMPATRHRFFVWHIMQKLPSKLGGLAIHADGLMDAINKAVYNAVSTDHFEIEWAKIRNQYNLKEDSWLEDMYTLREMWIPIFLRGMFFAGMSSSQRSESFNAFLKQFETHKCGLHDFMMRFERAITRQRYQELKAEHENLQTTPKLLTGLEMEEQMAGIYSRKIFHEFQGCPKRLKSSREKAQKKDRLCRGCSQRGVSHDKRNCPALLNR